MQQYDVIVVGAGIEGSSTAYQLAKRKKKVLFIEQFSLPHTRGSSHGDTRITRKAYGDDRFYTEMASISLDMVKDLEKESGQDLFKSEGCLIIGEKNSQSIKDTEKCFISNDIPYDNFGPDEMKQRYPNMSYEGDYRFLLDKSGGKLMADRMLAAYQDQFRKYGGDLKEGEKMLDVVPGKSNVTVTTVKGVYMSKSVVLTLGPWAAKFLPKIGLNLPLTPLRIPVCYWKEKAAGLSEGIATFASRDHDAYYGMPSDVYQGYVKICAHSGPEVDPDDISKANIQSTMEKLTAYVTRHFPTLQPYPGVQETCIYTRTPDKHFILDKHPLWENVIIGAGFSGHGFKLSPVVGVILADLSSGREPSSDIRPFKIARFPSNKL